MLQLQLLPPFMIQPTAQDPVNASSSANSLSASQKRIHLMLTKYVTTIRQDDYLQLLNQMLYSVSVGGSDVDIEGYYANRPELRNYTLGVELDRDLDYTLILNDGTTVTDKEEIRTYFKNNEDTSKETDHEGRDETELPIQELLIRAANQSLLADALAALSSSSEEVLIPSLQQDTQQNEVQRDQVLGLILSGPILNMTSVVEKCHFTIDIQRERVEGICVLAIVIPDEDRRLVLARAILVATFIPGEQESSRKLQYDMKMVKCHHFPTSRTIREAAISIARDQDNLLYQSCPARVESSRNTEAESSDDNTNEWDDKIMKLQRSFSLFNR